MVAPEKNPLKQKNYFLKYLSVATPLMISYLSVTLISLGDTVMVNWLGKEYCSEASMANLIFAIPSLFIIGFTTVLPPLVAAAAVRKNYKKATSQFIHMLVINLSFATATFFFLLFISSHLMGASVSAIAYYEDATTYFRIIVSSIIPYSFLLTMKRYMQSIGKRWSRHVMALDILAGLCNVFFNYLFIYGRWGCPELGMPGAGWATLLTRCIFLCINLLYLVAMHKKGYIAFQASLSIFKIKTLKKIIHLGLPSAMELTLRIFYMAIGNYMIKHWYGAELHAAASVLLEVARIALMVPLGVAVAASILVARAWGKRDPLYLKKISWAGYKAGLLLIILTGFFFYLFAPYCIRLLILEPQVRIEAYTMIGLAIMFNICDGLNIISGGMLRGIRDTFIPFLFSILNYLLLGLPMCYFLANYMNWKVTGIWLGLTLGYGMSAFLLAIRFFYRVQYLTQRFIEKSN